MSYPVLARRDSALDDAETIALLRDRLGDGVVGDVVEYGELTIDVAPSAWHAAVATCRDDERLAFDLFDCLFGVDAGEAGLDVITVLYSTSKGRRVMLRARCEGGRENPSLPTLTDLYVGANWHEREAFDMFGIDFDDHPGLLPRILCVENFEGWPLRKEFPLASRVAKPWPGVKDPAEPDEDGNVVVREPAIGEAPGPSGLDELIAKQAREANATPDAEIDADGSSSGGADAANAASEEPVREEVQLDQDVYDQLIADGKSERIARSKAKAAFIKKQRAAEREAAEADDADQEDEAPASPDGEVGGGTTGETVEEAAPPPSMPDDDGTTAGAEDATDATAEVDRPADASTDGDDAVSEPDVDTDAAAAASATAEARRAEQADAREQRAADEGSHDDADGDVEPIPASAPPPDEDEPSSGDDAPSTEDGEPTDVDAGVDPGADAPTSDATSTPTDADRADDDEFAADGTTSEGSEADVDQPGAADAGSGEDEVGVDESAAATDEAGEPSDEDATDGPDQGTDDVEDAAPTPTPDGDGDGDDDDEPAARADGELDDDRLGATDRADAGESIGTEDEAGPEPEEASDVEPEAPDDQDADEPDLDEPDLDDDGPEVPEPGPFGAGSAHPRADGSGPAGWDVKATTAGNVYHTVDSPRWRQFEADVWFDAAETAEAAGFDHWDPYGRTDLESTGPDVDDDGEIDVQTGPTSTDDELPAAPTGAGASSATHDIDGDDQVERVAESSFAGDHDGVHDGPYGPGSAIPGAGGSGPDGWPVKATSTGNLFHTPDSPTYDDVTADAWFVDAEAARTAGFEHWDTERREGMGYDEVGEGVVPTDRTLLGDGPPDYDSATASDDAEGDPGPVGGTLERDGGPADPARTGEEPQGFGALDTHEREPVADLPDDQSEASHDGDDEADDEDPDAREGDDA